MKIMFKPFTLTVLILGSITSQAWATDSIVRDRLGSENMSYFQQKDKNSSGAIARNSGYDFATTPMERAAIRDKAYWTAVGSLKPS